MAHSHQVSQPTRVSFSPPRQLPIAVLLLILLPAQSFCQTGETQAGSRKSAHWVPYTQQGEIPTSGEDFSLTYDPVRHRMILFGGKNDQNKNINQTWALDLATKQWTNFTSDGLNPPPREDHSVIHDPIGDRMILHGGENNEGTENGTWALDLKSMKWTDITSPGAPPSEDHTAIYDSKRKRMIVYGGQNSGNMHTTPYALGLDPATSTFQQWELLTIKENKKKKDPVGRVDHVAIYDPKGDRMIIFGGWDEDQEFFMDDTWGLDFEKMTWHEYARKNRSSKPPARRHAAFVYDKKNDWMLIFGGTVGGLLNDVWAFDLNVDEWINLSPGPPPRKDHALIFDARDGVMILYGGETVSDGVKLHDMWQLSVP